MRVRFDMRQFEKKARQVGIFARDQLPYAISRTLNDTMHQDTRPHIINVTWPAAFTVRNSGLPRAAIRVENSSKGERPWTAGVFDALGRAHLEDHARGGTKDAASGHLAIPNQKRVKLHARGKTPKPRALDRKIPSRALRVIKGKGIFVGRGGRLHAWFWFKKSAKLDKRFSFYRDFATVSTRGIRRRFPPRIQQAINSSFYR